MNVRDTLNMLKWKREFDFDKVEIWYTDRGAPGDMSVLKGADVERIGRSFIYTRNKTIPFHRVIKIVYMGRTIFDRFGEQKQE